MKNFSKFVVGILLILSFPLDSHSQQGWFQQVSGTTLNLYSVYFIDANTGFVAADNGYILKTTNSGTNWTLINTGANRKLWQIVFINSSTGFAMSDTITYRSSDCGVTWNYVINGLGVSLSFINQTTGYGLYIFQLKKTTNAGLNWTPVSNILIGPGGYTGLYFRNESTGYVAGWLWHPSYPPFYRAIILKTTNSGTNWDYVYTGVMGGWAAIYDCDFISDSFGAAVEVKDYNYYFNKTTNAGQNWSQTSLPQLMRSVRVTDVNTGWTCGANGTILHTTNGGTSWGAQVSGVSDSLNSLYMLNQNTGWIVGNNGVILKTTNGGPSGINPISNEVPSVYRLYQNYPNPFNPVTKIRFDVTTPLNPPEGGTQVVRLVIYDILGRETAVLIDEQLKPGSYEVEWDGSNHPSGLYFYKLRIGSFSESKKMILLK